MPLLCKRCRKEPATVHFTQIVAEATRRADLCIYCAEQFLPKALVSRLPATPLPAETSVFAKVWPALTERDYRLLEFLAKCITEAHSISDRTRDHVPAKEILPVAASVAQALHGDRARIELMAWGIVSSSTLGAAIFRFIDQEVFSGIAEDRIEDFHVIGTFDHFLQAA